MVVLANRGARGETKASFSDFRDKNRWFFGFRLTTIEERQRGMPVHASTKILMLSNTQAKELAGRVVTIGGARCYFKCYDPGQPGQPPWRSGAEGKAYPLLDQDGSVAAYLKFFTHPTSKRLDRTAWLIGQKMHTWLPNLAAAPVLWTDTRHGLHGAKIDFHFTAYLATAVPGDTWLEHKSGIAGGGTLFPEDLRWRCVRDMLLALAALEGAELVHGDLSPNNVILDLDAQPHTPALYLIDFDAFFLRRPERTGPSPWPRGAPTAPMATARRTSQPLPARAMVPPRPTPTVTGATCCCWNCC